MPGPPGSQESLVSGTPGSQESLVSGTPGSQELLVSRIPGSCNFPSYGIPGIQELQEFGIPGSQESLVSRTRGRHFFSCSLFCYLFLFNFKPLPQPLKNNQSKNSVNLLFTILINAFGSCFNNFSNFIISD